METKPTEISSSKMFGGFNKRYKHFSPTLGCTMTFHIYFPPSCPAAASSKDNEHWVACDRCGKWRLLPIGMTDEGIPEKWMCSMQHWLPRGKNNCEVPQDVTTQHTSTSSPSHKFPVLYWLSGLTCTDENFIAKSGAQRAASNFGIALIAPDTSPRGLHVEGEADSWDFGVGAGFYLNAKQEKWKNWRMYDYVVKELPALLAENFPQLDTSKASISGHSMGGHGALTIYLKNLDKYKSVSAFSPVVNPINCPWGQKAFSNYLGENKSEWEEYDATCLVSKFNDIRASILIDQGDSDKFLEDQLMPGKFQEACKTHNVPLLLRLQPGYDHSYFFIATFIDDHISHHAQALNL